MHKEKRGLQKEVSSSGIEVASKVSTAQPAVVCTTGRLQEQVDNSGKNMRVSVNLLILTRRRKFYYAPVSIEL